MPAPSSERALRQLVANLSKASPNDIDAVLTELDADQRQTVEGMLALYRGQATPPPAAGPGPALAGLSSWLSERLSPAAAAELGPLGVRTPSGPVADMTAAASAALRASAMEMLRLGLATPAPATIEARPTPLLQRLRSTVLARRTVASRTFG